MVPRQHPTISWRQRPATMPSRDASPLRATCSDAHVNEPPRPAIAPSRRPTPTAACRSSINSLAAVLVSQRLPKRPYRPASRPPKGCTDGPNRHGFLTASILVSPLGREHRRSATLRIPKHGAPRNRAVGTTTATTSFASSPLGRHKWTPPPTWPKRLSSATNNGNLRTPPLQTQLRIRPAVSPNLAQHSVRFLLAIHHGNSPLAPLNNHCPELFKSMNAPKLPMAET